MTMDTLQSDADGVSGAVRMLSAATTPADIAAFIKNELWPFITNHVAETAEMDGVLSDLIENAEDILQPETARVFAAVIAGGAVVIAALRARITKEADPQLFKVIAEFEGNLKNAGEILEEIVIDPGEGDEEEEDDDEEEEDEDGTGALPDDEDEEDDDESEEPDEGDAP